MLSLQRQSTELIATRAKHELRSIDTRWPHLSRAERVIDAMAESMLIMHDYYVEQMREEHGKNTFLLEQMQTLLDSLMTYSK